MTPAKRLWPGYYDVVILPPPLVWNHALELSRKLHQMGGQWRLGETAFLPHISLYHIPVRNKDLEDFLNELQLIAEATQWGSLETTAFDMPVIMVSKPDWLKNLHERVVRRTVRFLDPRYQVAKTWSLERFSGRRLEFARKYLKEFGTPMAGMNFRPHITLSSFKGKEPAAANLHVRKIRFRVNRLHVCELGQSHTCHRIIREI
jgi:2'-5' RNA ligase